MRDAVSANPTRRRAAPAHALYKLRNTVRELGSRVIDRRTSVGKALGQWRAELIADLGGADSVSTQEKALIDLAVRSKLILDSIDSWLLNQGSLVDRRRRALLPAVRERQQLADALARYLGQLGLKRRPPQALTIDTYLEQKYGTGIREADDQSDESTDSGAGEESQHGMDS